MNASTAKAAIRGAAEPLLKRFGRSSDFGRSIARLITLSAVGQAVTLLASPALTRLYEPAAHGFFSALVASVTIISSISSVRYECALPICESEKSAGEVLGLVAILLFAASMLTYLIGSSAVLLWDTEVALRLGNLALPAAVAVLVVGANQALVFYAVRRREYTAVGRSKLVFPLVSVFVQVGAGLLGFKLFGLVGGYVAAQASAAAFLYSAVMQPGWWKGVTLEGIRDAARRYVRFPRYSAGAGLLNAIGQNGPSLVLVWLYGPVFGGLFALGQRVIGAPVTLLGDSLSQVVHGEMSARKSRLQRRDLLRKTIVGVLLAAALPILVLGLVSPVVFPAMFGTEWAEAGWVALSMVPMSIARLVGAVAAPVLDVVERQDLHARREIGRFLVMLVTLGLGGGLGLAPIQTVILYSLGASVAYGYGAMLSWTALRS